MTSSIRLKYIDLKHALTVLYSRWQQTLVSKYIVNEGLFSIERKSWTSS